MTAECPTAFADMANAHPIRRPARDSGNLPIRHATR